ncbi:MAG: hypothetical protein HRT89_12680, partial [Lentisphaeria bacterium]|nr:hypothetical protein [Lentisphaeria bacterium]
YKGFQFSKSGNAFVYFGKGYYAYNHVINYTELKKDKGYFIDDTDVYFYSQYEFEKGRIVYFNNYKIPQFDYQLAAPVILENKIYFYYQRDNQIHREIIDIDKLEQLAKQPKRP